MDTPLAEFGYHAGDAAHTGDYLMPTVFEILAQKGRDARIFELGCGNGANAAALTDAGYRLIGIDPSTSGIAIANSTYPQCRLESGSSDEDLAARFGTFDVVLSLEVAEHVYSPGRYSRAIHDLLVPGGIAIVSTPYHGYLKNLALAASGRLDDHFTALWEGGHIKFWSHQTLTALFGRLGMAEVSFHRIGRFPALAKSMIGVYRRPETPNV